MRHIFIGTILLLLLSAGTAMAMPGSVDFRVRGGTAGWDAAIFSDNNSLDQYGLSGDSGSVWGVPLSFSLDYSAITGVATFVIENFVTLSHTFAPGTGFGTINIYAQAMRDTKFNVPDDESQIDVLFNGSNYQAQTSGPWVETNLNSGTALSEISLTGTIAFVNEVFAGSGDERLKAGVKFKDPVTFTGEASPVPVPGAAWLLGTGLLGLVAMRRKII